MKNRQVDRAGAVIYEVLRGKKKEGAKEEAGVRGRRGT